MQQMRNVSSTLETELTSSRNDLAEERACLISAQNRLDLHRSETHEMQDKIHASSRERCQTEEQHSRISSALEAGIRDRDARLEERERTIVQAREAAATAAANTVAQRQQVEDLKAIAD